MSDFEARLAALVEDGTYKSRGEALRELVSARDPEAIAYTDEFIKRMADDADSRAWMGVMLNSLAGARPALPNIANRSVAYAGQAAGVGVQGLMETFQPRWVDPGSDDTVDLKHSPETLLARLWAAIRRMCGRGSR